MVEGLQRGDTTAVVHKVSCASAVIDPVSELKPGRCVQVRLEFRGSRALSLLARVEEKKETDEGLVLRWQHESVREAQRLEDRLVHYAENLKALTEGADEPAEPEDDTARLPAYGSTREEAASGPPEPLGRDLSAGQAALDPLRKKPRKRKRATPAGKPDVAVSPPPASGMQETSQAKSNVEMGPREAALATPGPQRGEGESDMDVGKKILRRARTVRASDLAARTENVQVLGMTAIKTFIQEAVDEAAQHLQGQLAEDERRRLLEEAEEGFRERLETFHAEKAGLEEKTRRLEEQLSRAQGLLDEERQKVVSADRFTVSDRGLVEIETRLHRMLERVVRDQGISATLEEEMRSTVSRLLDDERQKISDQEQQAQSDRVRLLERKVDRLARSLEDAEKARDKAQRRAHALESSGVIGLRNVETIGLDDDDPDRDKKLALLKEIFEENKRMREALIARALPDWGAESSERQAVEPVPSESEERCGSKEVAAASFEGSEPVATVEVTEPETVGETGELEVQDPDDLPWEPPANETEDPLGEREEITESGIKRIVVDTATVKPPPLERAQPPAAPETVSMTEDRESVAAEVT